MYAEGEETVIKGKRQLEADNKGFSLVVDLRKTLSECMNVLKVCVPINDLDRTRHLDFITVEGFYK